MDLLKDIWDDDVSDSSSDNSNDDDNTRNLNEYIIYKKNIINEKSIKIKELILIIKKL